MEQLGYIVDAKLYQIIIGYSCHSAAGPPEQAFLNRGRYKTARAAGRNVAYPFLPIVPGASA